MGFWQSGESRYRIECRQWTGLALDAEESEKMKIKILLPVRKGSMEGGLDAQ